MSEAENKILVDYTKQLWNAKSASHITELLVRFNEQMKEVSINVNPILRQAQDDNLIPNT